MTATQFAVWTSKPGDSTPRLPLLPLEDCAHQREDAEANAKEKKKHRGFEEWKHARTNLRRALLSSGFKGLGI